MQLPQEYISRLLVPHALLSTAYLWLTVSTCLCVYVGVLCAPAQQELETHLFEELEPCAIVAKRGSATEEGAGPVEYLVNWGDGSEETWEVRTRTCLYQACVLHCYEPAVHAKLSSSDMHTHTLLSHSCSRSATSRMTSSRTLSRGWSTRPRCASWTAAVAA